MLEQKFFIVFLIEFIISARFIVNIDAGPGCSKPTQKSAHYTAAVVEFQEVSVFSYTYDDVVFATNKVTDIIESNELNPVDIVVFPETILNRPFQAIELPNTKRSYCGDSQAGYVLGQIACAAQKADKYVVVNLFAKINCSVDDQPCTPGNSSNLYNMGIVFNRNGEVIAKYRKYNLFAEDDVKRTQNPDLITFKTDFNVTFGIGICFDLAFSDPMISLVKRGVKHFVYPTRWISKMPYFTATQYQQSWAYSNDVTLLAANVNSPDWSVSGSGIYSGRAGALKAFVSESPTTKVIIAEVPIVMPNQKSLSNLNQRNIEEISQSSSSSDYEMDFDEEDLTEFTVEFLNLSQNSNQTGAVCNKDICCNYTIEASDIGEKNGKDSYVYAISVFSGHRSYEYVEHLLIGQDVCSMIACTDMNDESTCGTRIPMSKVHYRYKFRKLKLETTFPISKRMKVMPNTLTQELLPLNTNEFEYELSEVKRAKKYEVTINLKKPKENLITFAIISRDYDRDQIHNETPKIVC